MSLCGQQVQITNTVSGQSITVTVADECPTCDNSNSIDLSVGAFSALSGNDLSEGVVDSKSIHNTPILCLLISQKSFGAS